MIGIGRFCKVIEVAGFTFCRCACISNGVTSHTIHYFVGACQWKISRIMVKGHICISCGVTGKTGIILIGVARYQLVGIVGLRILVTYYTGECSIIAGICMAGGTSFPGPLVLSGINGKVLSIVFSVIHGLPAGSQIMALLTIRTK